MAAYVSRLNHIALHVANADRIALDLVAKFRFKLFAARKTAGWRQLALRKGSAVFLVNERLEEEEEKKEKKKKKGWNPGVTSASGSADDDRSSGTGGGGSARADSTCLYGAQPSGRVDTACNVCFEVEDVHGAFSALRERGCRFLVPPTPVEDHEGLVLYSVLKSVVGNVCHTLVDRTGYRGDFLPGFREVRGIGDGERAPEGGACSVTHFDHVTYACPRRMTPEVMKWYEGNFGFQRFLIGRNEDVNEGFVLDRDGIGLRLTAMEFWKCSESGVKLPFRNDQEPDCKFVIAESLPHQGPNQVDSFLEQHGGAGIQHVGLYTQDIVSTARTLAQAGVQFVSPPPAYYSQVGKQQEILDAGHDPQLLSQHGILLDTDLRQDASGSTPRLASGENKR
ncbi:4-hydroxyphenylpyruvate dioxygenase-like protein isoform X2 [Scleropages formosus]|nr:4-hydroxyphenylpyruvate dioxygenase-like protein isoform X2 [Scleropages formosus]